MTIDDFKTEREQAYEYGLPEYLQHDLDAYKEGLETNSSLLDCLWGELYGSINLAAISEVLSHLNMLITLEKNICLEVTHD